MSRKFFISLFVAVLIIGQVPMVVLAAQGNSGAGSGNTSSGSGNTSTGSGSGTSDGTQGNNSSAGSGMGTGVGMYGSLTDEERDARIAELQGMGKEERCTTLEGNIGNRQNYYVQNMESYQNSYQHMYQVVEAATLRLGDLGIDVTPLEGLLTQLQEQMQTMTQLKTQLQTQMQSAYSYACDEANAGQYRSQVSAASQTMAQVRSQIQQMNQLLREEIIAALNEIQAYL